MSFGILQSSDDIMSAKGNHTIAVVKGKEDYDLLRECFADVFRDINEVVTEKKIDLDGETVNLEFFLGGDYKFILLMMGLSGASSNHACVWCKIHKDQRWDMHHDLDYYNSPPMQRTLEEMHNLAGKKKNYCCVHAPILNIELSHVVIDELHLLLRIMDVLIGNLVQEALQWDKRDNWGKKASEQNSVHVNHLIDVIRSCGVSFDIWEKTNADKKGSGLYDFTSLLGSDKKKLLKELPEKLDGVIPPLCESTVKTLWEKFSIVYSIVTCKTPSEEMIADYFHKAQEWVKLFVSLRDKAIGYKKANVTPYIHAMVYHVPIFFQTFKTVKLFTGQGVEKNNDVARTIVLRKSNKMDGPGDVLKLESRQWELKNRERTKREYNKQNDMYWEHELIESRQNKRKKFKKNESPIKAQCILICFLLCLMPCEIVFKR